jgi:hypothetical protein
MKKISKFYFILLISYFLLPTFLFAQSGWGPDVRLTYRQGYSYDPKAACNGDTIHLVWWEGYVDSGIHEEVFYKRSTDAGVTWGGEILLSTEDDKSSVLPWIAVNGNYLHIVWQQQDVGICYRRSIDGGNSWLSIDTLPNGGSGNPSACVIENNVYVVAYRSDGKVIFSKSTDNGDTWQPSQDIGFSCATRPRIKNLMTSQSILMLTCENYVTTVEIYYKESTDMGVTWSDSQCVSEYGFNHSFHQAFSVDDSGGIHIGWCDYKYSPYAWTGDIFYRASRDSGNSWETIDSLTVMHRAVASDILAESSNLHLVWEDDRNGFGNNFEIYYRMSRDLGQSWQPEVRLTDTLNRSCGPSLACDGQFLHLFWFDLRDDPSNIVGEIYYKRKTLTGIGETIVVTCLPSGLSLACPTILRRNRWIQYDLGNMKEGEVKIMDITGRVMEIFPVHGIAGEFVLDFNKEVCDGVYFIVLRADKEYTTKKVLVVR